MICPARLVYHALHSSQVSRDTFLELSSGHQRRRRRTSTLRGVGHQSKLVVEMKTSASLCSRRALTGTLHATVKTFKSMATNEKKVVCGYPATWITGQTTNYTTPISISKAGQTQLYYSLSLQRRALLPAEELPSVWFQGRGPLLRSRVIELNVDLSHSGYSRWVPYVCRPRCCKLSRACGSRRRFFSTGCSLPLCSAWPQHGPGDFGSTHNASLHRRTWACSCTCR